MKGWAKVMLGAGVFAGIGYALRMNRTSSQMETVASAKIHKLDFSGLTIRVDVQIKNPTKGSLSLKYPFVKLIYKEATIGSSQSINKDIKIPSYGEARIEEIMIQIPLTGLLSVVADLIKSLKSGAEGVKMQIKTVTTIDIGFKSIPYEKTDEVILKK